MQEYALATLLTAHDTKFWTMQDNLVRDNCFNNTFSLAKQLDGKGIDMGSPLYIASSWKEASIDIVQRVSGNPNILGLTGCWLITCLLQ